MIEVLLNKPEFEYDIHSLIKAFFPEQYVGVSAEKKEYDEKIDIRMQVNYGEDTIQITWQEIVHANEDAQANEKPGQEEVKEIPGETIQVDFSDRVRTKNQLKQMLYRMLCDYTKRTLPWGNLTGIRPTKIPMKLLEEGKSREEIYRYMKDTYFASDEKIELATDIAERENAILKKIDYDNGYSLYIGIPFCPTTCLYCSFTSYPLVSWKNRVDAYLDALEKEIDYTAAKFYHKHLNSIYIGGGTPTTLEPYQLDRLIRKIKCSFDLSDCLEFTVEAGRPDSITREKLEVLRKWGITRISINPQTMQQRTLDLIGRGKTVRAEGGHIHRSQTLAVCLPCTLALVGSGSAAPQKALGKFAHTLYLLVYFCAPAERRYTHTTMIPQPAALVHDCILQRWEVLVLPWE